MSVKNKAKDRNKKGKIKRKYTGPFPTSMLKAPKSFRKQLNREFRAKNKHILRNGPKSNYQNLEFVAFKKSADWLWI